MKKSKKKSYYLNTNGIGDENDAVFDPEENLYNNVSCNENFDFDSENIRTYPGQNFLKNVKKQKYCEKKRENTGELG